LPLRPLLQFQNPDSTRDLNETNLVFNKGVFSGGQVVAGTVADGLAVRLEAFATVGNDGMLVHETELTTLSVIDGVRNFIVLRSIYKDNAEPTVQVESLSEAAYLGDGEIAFLIVFAVVDVPLLSTFITQNMIEFQEADIVDTLGRLSLRGTITNSGNLPSGVLNTNRAGDFYIVSSGESDIPEMYVWNGTNWENITQTTVLSNLLDEHIANLSDNAKHLTNQEKEAAAGTTGTPSSSNKYVTELDPRVPQQSENDGMTGDPTILSGTVNEEAAGYYGGEPGPDNQFTVNSKIFAVPDEKAFTSLAVIELLESDGPIYVGKDGGFTAQKWFNVFDEDTTGENRDKELINSQGRPVRVTGVFTEASLTNELNTLSASVDDLGFWRRFDLQGTLGGPLYLQLSDGDVDGQADVNFRIGYGRRTTMQDLLPQAFIERGPQFGQIDSRMNQVLVTDTTPNFRDSEWDVATGPGDVIAFDSVGGDLVLSDLPGNLFPVGLRGNFNNLIQDGIYEFPAPTAFVAGDMVWADEVTPGGLTVSTNDRFVGTFLTSSKLLVSMNSIGLAPTTNPPGTPFPGGLINASPGQAIAWNAGANEFQPWELAFAGAPMGILGNANNLITNEQWVPGGAPFLDGVRYYAWYAGAPGGVLSPGDLTTTQNDYFVGRAVLTDSLMVECINAPNWETVRGIIAAEHNTGAGYHLEGSARSWIGPEANRFAASNGQASSTGMIYYASDTGRVFYCSNGAGNTWIEQTRFTGPVTIDNNAIVSGQIRMPLKQLHDNVSDLMNPFAHNDRHQLGDVDYLKGRVEQIASDMGTGGSPVLFTTTPNSQLADNILLTVNIDFTGRTGLSTVLVWTNLVCATVDAGQYDINFAVFLDGVELTTPECVRGELDLQNTVNNTDMGSLTAVLKTVTATPHVITLQAGVKLSALEAQALGRQLVVLDMGLT
jgi:hypothetical protein